MHVILDFSSPSSYTTSQADLCSVQCRDPLASARCKNLIGTSKSHFHAKAGRNAGHRSLAVGVVERWMISQMALVQVNTKILG